MITLISGLVSIPRLKFSKCGFYSSIKNIIWHNSLFAHSSVLYDMVSPLLKGLRMAVIFTKDMFSYIFGELSVILFL